MTERPQPQQPQEPDRSPRDGDSVPAENTSTILSPRQRGQLFTFLTKEIRNAFGGLREQGASPADITALVQRTREELQQQGRDLERKALSDKEQPEDQNDKS